MKSAIESLPEIGSVSVKTEDSSSPGGNDYIGRFNLRASRDVLALQVDGSSLIGTGATVANLEVTKGTSPLRSFYQSIETVSVLLPIT